MLKKIAFCDIVPLNQSDDGKLGLIKTASGGSFVKPESEAAKIIEAEIKKHPTALFFRAKAIKADEMNSNGDYFSKEELLKYYKTFEGVPFFTNHDNQNVENARGKVIYAEWDEEENAVYTVNFVDREAYPDLCRSIEKEYVTGVSMGALSEGSMILMADGREKAIEDVESGDKVVSHNGNINDVKLVHEEYLAKDMYSFGLSTYHKAPLFTEDHPIWAINCDEIVCAKNEAIKVAQKNQHERRMGRTSDFVGQDGWRSSNYNPSFKEAENVSEGDHFLIPSKYKLKGGASNSDLYYLIGAYLGDGYLRKDKNGKYEGVSFCLNINEIELAGRITNILSKISEKEVSSMPIEARNGLYLTIYDRDLANWFDKNIGTGSKNKRLKLNIDYIDDAKSLISGYLDTDGCIVNKTNQNTRGSNFGGFQLSSSNIALLEDVQSLLIALGSISRISTFEREPSEKSVVNVNTIEHTLAIGSNASELFDKSIKYSSSDFNKAEIKAGQSFIYNENGLNYMACPVKSIEKIVYEKPVYDLTVDRDESYIADGVAVHNCSVEYSTCCICNNKAERTEDYCIHIKNRKGRTFTGKAKDVVTGETKTFKNAPVYEYNFGIKFIELSAVVDPACPSCHIDHIVTDNENYLQKVANLQNSIYMVKTAAIQKQASEDDLNQLNSCLETLESIAVGLIQNRQQVEVEFASDLVSILSELQTFVDELTGAGYGQVPGSENAPEGMEGMEGMEGPAVDANADLDVDADMGAMPPQAGVPAMPAAQPVSATNVQPTEVGNVSGGQGASPAMPSAPAMPILSFNTDKLQKVASFIPQLAKIKDQISNEEDEDMAKRRTLAAKKTQKDDVIEKLSNSWKEKQEFIEYINKLPSTENNGIKLSVKKTDENFVIIAELGEANKAWTYEDLSENDKKVIKEDPKGASLHFIEAFTNMNKIKGDNKMTNKREAGANSVNKEPEVVTEAQLKEQRDLYHAREESDRETITENQLDKDTGSHKRSGEQEVITEAQLEGKDGAMPREDDNREVITEAQLDAKKGAMPKTEDEKEVITQKQLDDYRSGEQDVITEKQLDSVDTPWERAASRDASQFKSASNHMSLVVDALADTTLQTGCTPSEVCKVASSLVASTKSRFDFGNAILSGPEASEEVNYADRVAFWSTKNVRVASVGSEVVSSALVEKLKVVASDETIDPETVITAIDVATEDQAGIERVTERVEEKVAEASQVEENAVSAKAELRDALKTQASKQKDAREEERKEILASIDSEEISEETQEEVARTEEVGNADTLIEATFDEIGLEKEASRDENFKSAIASFTKGAMASRQQKVAAITNVTISGDTISIAVQTDTGEQSIEIPVGEEVAPAEEAMPVEGDLSGEALDAGIPSYASRKDKIQKEAQAFMGGGTGGDVGAPAGGNADPSMGLDAPAPETEGIQSFTGDEEVPEADIPTTGEQQLPYAICPECGSADVDIERDKEGGISGSCQSCGAEYEALIKKEIEFKIVTPTKSVGEDGVALAEAPEVPALPVAASTRVGKDSIVRIASNKEKHGEVCPACGMSGHEGVKAASGAKEFTCTACNTKVSKEIVVSSENPEDAHLVVSWDHVMEPKGCDECTEAKKAFASKVKIEQLMKKASDSDFPMANCKELVAKKYGGNAVATYGPCKGEVLADCVCKDLSKFALRSVRHMEKLADVYSQDDPMDECVEDQQKHGKNVKEASEICNCLKDKYDESGNVFEQAFSSDVEEGSEKVLTASDLKVMADFLTDEVEEGPAEDVDMADAFPTEEETVTVELPLEVAEEVADAVTKAVAPVEEVEVEITEELAEETDVEPDMDSASELEVAAESVSGGISEEDGKELAMAMQSHKLRRVGEEVVKVASTPEVVKDIEGDVKAGVPRKDETLGNEGAENINVPMSDPSVPRGNAEMGQEGAGNVNPSAGLPDVAVDSSYMGDEAKQQAGTPEINNKLKGTVIAENDTVTKEAGLETVETVEGEVEAGIPRADATIGHEGKDNVDVDAGKPDVPRGNAEMGNEGADNINPKADMPDVPVDGNATMGHEDETLKDTPAVSNKYLKQVEQSEKKDLQLERLANARKMEAIKVASKLVATDRLQEEAYDDAVEALSQFKIDKIASVADNMFPARQRKVASIEETGHSIPAIVQESKDTIKTASTEESLQDKLSKHLTIGNKKFDDKLKEWGEK